MNRRSAAKIAILGCLAALIAMGGHECSAMITVPTSARSLAAKLRVESRLREEWASLGLRWGAPVLLRGFKESLEMEVWVETKPNGPWKLAKRWAIANYGGKGLGPKLMEGDRMAPEGFYTVGASQLNPNSSYHLALNVGYPNAYDRFHQRTGSFLMIHGSDVSIGCYAMTNPSIEEIYTILSEALAQGQQLVPVHLFPFHPTDARIAQAKGSPWYDFWLNLKEGYDYLAKHQKPPQIGHENGRYVVK